jgi:hypothetical protein
MLVDVRALLAKVTVFAGWVTARSCCSFNFWPYELGHGSNVPITEVKRRDTDATPRDCP